MGRDRAAYMRTYRARKAESVTRPATGHAACQARIAELEAEVRHLKTERPAEPVSYAVPSQGRSMTQAERDDVLRRVNGA